MPRIISAFQDVRIFSSRPGQTRALRICSSLARAESSRASTSALPVLACSAIRATGWATNRCQRPSKFGGRSSPKRGANTVHSSGVELAAHLFAVPHVELAFVALRVGIAGWSSSRPRATACLADRPFAVCDGDSRVERIAGRHARPPRTTAEQRAVVVQHLLEVRNRPVRIDGVARRNPPPSWSLMPPSPMQRSVRVAM